MRITGTQHDYLMNKLRSTRVASRKLGNKTFSYLESWDVRAHLIRLFGFGNFDAEVIETKLIGTYEYQSSNGSPMVEVMWQVVFRLVIRAQDGNEIARYTETAVGSATKGRDGAGLGDIHDNAIKSATSDALKRCAINLGTQFGLSLYNNGSKDDVVRNVLVVPEGGGLAQQQPANKEAEAALGESLGAVPVTPTGEGGNEGGYTQTAEVEQQVADAPPNNGRPGSQHVAEKAEGDKLEQERQDRVAAQQGQS